MKKLLFFIYLIFLFVQSVSAQNGSTEIAKAIANALGKDVRGYKIYSYPIDNFGVGTACLNKWTPKGIVVCDMIEFFNLKNEKPGSDKWKWLNGYAYEATGNSINLKDTITNNYGLTLLLPKILKMLSINFDAHIKNSKSIELTIDSAVIRHLDYLKVKAYIDAFPEGNKIKTAFESKRMLVATSDIALLKYSLTINLKDNFGITLSGKIDSAMKISSFVLNKDSLGVSISKIQNGTYVVSSSKPVIFGIYVQKQKNIEPDAAVKTFDDWGDAVKPEEINDPSKP
jgi:hypothetical protein